MKLKSLVAAVFAVLFLYVTVFSQSPTTGTVIKNANLRDGPGTTYAVAGTVKAGQTVNIIGKNNAGDWYQLDSKSWIATFLVNVDTTIAASPTKAKATQQATPTPSPTLNSQTNQINIHNDPAARAYGTELKKALNLYTDGAKIVNEHFLQVAANPAIMLNKTWQTGMALGLSELNLCSEAIRKLFPPPYLIDAHADLLVMADHLDNAVKLWASGIDTLNGDMLKKGANEFALTGSLAKSANEKMTALLDANTPTPNAISPASTPNATITRTPVATTKSIISLTATPKLAWYSGGTLHKATVVEWKAADERNKLATAADWAYVGFDNIHFSSPDEVRPYAEQVVICVDTALDGSENMGDSVTDIAILCIAIMKAK